MNSKIFVHVEPDTRNLMMNFSQFLGHECRVKITPWNEGIYWTNVTEIEQQTIKVISEFGVPFVGICKEEGAAKWLATFPSGLQEKLIAYELKYLGTIYLLLWCISRSKYAQELFESNPFLVWIVLKTAKSQCWDTESLLAVFSCKRTKILLACGLGESKTVLKTIQKLKMSYYSYVQFRQITTYDWHDVSNKLTHLPFVDMPLLKFLEHYPELATAKLIQTYGERWCWKVFKRKVEYTLNMGADLGHKDIMARIGSCKDMQKLITLHDKLASEINGQAWESLPVVEYGEPPISGTSVIVPITNNHHLHREGKEQSNCVSSYHVPIFQEKYYVYKILTPQRATLGIKLTKGGYYSIDEILLKGNKAVDAGTRGSVMDWFNNSINSYRPRPDVRH